MMASSSYLLENVKVLAAHGASLNLRDDGGNTALHYSAMAVGFYQKYGKGTNDDSVYEYLLAKGAKADMKNLAGVTPEQIFINHKGYFANKDALLKELINLISANPTSYNFRVRQGPYIHAIEFSGTSTTTIDLSGNFSFSFSANNLTLTMNDTFVFKLSSIQELNNLQNIINNIQKFAKTL
jgi:ankyrin repeat protein